MIRPKKTSLQTYTDGWGTSWEVSDRRLVAQRQEIIHYADFTVGMYRYWEAMIAGTQIKRAILVPERTAITEGDVFIDSDGTQYEVRQVDRKDTRPVSLLVSLSSAQVTYRRRDNGIQNDSQNGSGPDAGGTAGNGTGQDTDNAGS